MTFKVVLINPNIPGDYRKSKVSTANLGIGFLSSYIQMHNSADVTIIDGRFLATTALDVFKKIENIEPQLIGISLCVDEASLWVDELLKLIKKHRTTIPIALGGYFPSLLPQKVLEKFPLADLVVLGEGEQTFSELITTIQENKDWKKIPGIAYRHEKNILFTPPRNLLENLDDLPFAHRYLAEGNGQNMEVMLEGTRGCLFQCSFCAVHPFYKNNIGSKLRMRSAEHIYKEIYELCQQYPKLQSFRFVDPDFISPSTQKRALEFVSLLKKLPLNIHFMVDTRIPSINKNRLILQGLKEVGLKRLYLGIESGSEKILKKMNKGIHKEEIIKAIDVLKTIGIDYSYGFMMITPWTLKEDIEKNIDLLRKIGRIEFRSLFHEMTLIPGTQSYQEIQNDQRLFWCGSLSYYSYQTLCPRVEKFRKISKLLRQKYSVCFGDAAGYLYESIRQLRRIDDITLAESLEMSLDQLFLDIFHDCWQISSNLDLTEYKENQFIENCYQQFSPRFLKLLHSLDTTLSFSSTVLGVPRHGHIRQI